ncbi:hypothetical protein NQ314_012512 [Rhamnusium bicolor]|uniref:Uncharacterized protein n=1 Tax=Rhamnusium bicolor TaxID=1586634 RepID=A0AAV8XBR4_9CUCU|nr:hypothetical protein NQ314_012512 [Rhamnusium bicolor]
MADDIMDTSTDQSMDPKDKSRLLLFCVLRSGNDYLRTAKLLHYCQRCGIYWMYKFRDPNVTYNNSDNNKTELQRNFTAYYTTISSICMITFLILTVIYVKKVSLQRRIVGPLVIILLLFFVTMVFIWTDTDSWQQGFFIVSLIIGALISDVFFVPVCTFLSYSVFDFIGREVSLHWKKLENVYLILTISVLRIGFIPLIMLCNAQPRNHLPVVFDQDYTYIIFMIIFAFTTGYFLNLCVLEIPSICEPNEKNYAVVLVAVAMVISTGVCSGLGSLMVHLL